MIKLYSPDGKCSIFAHPYKVNDMKKNGWTEKPVSKTKKVKKNGNI